MKYCRFDYAIKAVEALKEYVDSAPIEVNTLRLIRTAKTAIDSLETLEKSIQFRKFRERPIEEEPSVLSALKEVQEKFSELEPLRQSADEFLKNNKLILSQIEMLQKQISGIQNVFEGIQSIKGFLNKARKRLSVMSRRYS